MGLKLKKDKLKHMAGSFALTLATYGVSRKLWVAFLLVFVVGVMKEIYDIYHGVASWEDMAANLMGISFAVLMIYFLTKETPPNTP